MREYSLGSACLAFYRSQRLTWSSCKRHYASVKSAQNYYEVLGVKRNATAKEIKSAFLSQSKKLHPDMHPNDPSKHEKFVALNEAYTTLSKSLSRREYDRKLAASSAPGGRVYQQGGGARRASGPSGMYSDQPPPGTPFGAAGPDPFASHSYPRGKQKPFSPEDFYNAHYAESDRDNSVEIDKEKMKRHFKMFSTLLLLFFLQFLFLNRYVKLRTQQIREERRQRDELRRERNRNDLACAIESDVKDPRKM